MLEILSNVLLTAIERIAVAVSEPWVAVFNAAGRVGAAGIAVGRAAHPVAAAAVGERHRGVHTGGSAEGESVGAVVDARSRLTERRRIRARHVTAATGFRRIERGFASVPDRVVAVSKTWIAGQYASAVYTRGGALGGVFWAGNATAPAVQRIRLKVEPFIDPSIAIVVEVVTAFGDRVALSAILPAIGTCAIDYASARERAEGPNRGNDESHAHQVQDTCATRRTPIAVPCKSNLRGVL